MVMSAFSTMLPQLESAAYQLQLFSAFQAHAGGGKTGLVSHWVSSEAEGVLATLRSLPGLSSLVLSSSIETRLDWIRQGLQSDDPAAAYEDLVDLLPATLEGLEEARTQYNEEARGQLASLDRIVRGGRPDLAPLPSLSPPYPKVPAWAQEVTVRVHRRGQWETFGLPLNPDASLFVGKEQLEPIGLGGLFVFSPHVEISFLSGSFWIRDLGSRAGTFDQGRGIRLKPDVWCPLTRDGALRLGPRWLGPEVSFRWARHPLEDLRWGIAEVNSFAELKALLQGEPRTEGLAGQIDQWVQGGYHLSRIPEAGGLRWKVVELYLRQEFEPIRRRYLEAFREETARPMLDDLTRAVDAADSPAALAAALRGCLLPIGYTWAREVEQFFGIGKRRKGKVARSLDPFPEDLGIRRKMRLLWAGWEASVWEEAWREVEEAQAGRQAAEGELAEVRAAAAEEREDQRRRWEEVERQRAEERERADRLSEALGTIQTVDLAGALRRIGELEGELAAARREAEGAIEARKARERELAAAKEGLLAAAVEGEEDRRISDTLEEGGGVPLLPGLHYVVGRGTGSHIIVGERNVSWKHFEIVGTPDKWRIRDLQSRYGTRVNDKWVRAGWHPLQNGDEIRLGAEEEVVLVFTIVENGARAILTYPGKTPPPPATLPHDIVFHPMTAPKGGGSAFTIGRDRKCDVCLEGNSISRVHLWAAYDSVRSVWTVADPGSSNGSFLNGTRLEKNAWVYVTAGDRLRLGVVEFQVSFGPEGQLQLDRVDEAG